MRGSRSTPKTSLKPDWATAVFELRQRLKLSQATLAGSLHCSAMAISRWERGDQEPSAGGYIDLGNLAGAPLCWYFWARAGLRTEDLMRVMPKVWKRFNQTQVVDLQIASPGSGDKKSIASQLVAIPLLKAVAASHGGKGDSSMLLHDAPVETLIAAPKNWCPNPFATTCVRMRGNSMMPLIHDGYILVADSSQTIPAKLDGKVVIVWHKDMGLTVSRMQHYGNTDVLEPENRAYEPIVLDGSQDWKILAKVLWWIGNAP
jgi:SOS-response transcriptional repressor LexA/DNA-binding XRE family transcriptional regulator